MSPSSTPLHFGENASPEFFFIVNRRDAEAQRKNKCFKTGFLDYNLRRSDINIIGVHLRTIKNLCVSAPLRLTIKKNSELAFSPK
jgi:hypothetical protein